jgi:hypothetical protein
MVDSSKGAPNLPNLNSLLNLTNLGNDSAGSTANLIGLTIDSVLGGSTQFVPPPFPMIAPSTVNNTTFGDLGPPGSSVNFLV